MFKTKPEPCEQPKSLSPPAYQPPPQVMPVAVVSSINIPSPPSSQQGRINSTSNYAVVTGAVQTLANYYDPLRQSQVGQQQQQQQQQRHRIAYPSSPTVAELWSGSKIAQGQVATTSRLVAQSCRSSGLVDVQLMTVFRAP